MDKNVISVKIVEEKRGKFSEYTSLQWWSLSDTDFCKDMCVCVCVASYVLNKYIIFLYLRWLIEKSTQHLQQ